MTQQDPSDSQPLDLAAASLTRQEVQELREKHYNAEVSAFLRIHDELAIVRVRLNAGQLPFVPGQYTVLGLGYWERRVPGVQQESLAEEQLRHVVKRAYSISSPILDAAGNLVRPQEAAELEFYIALVRRAEQHVPALTPRLFALAVGDRLFVGPHAHGQYTLRGVGPDDDIIFAATGTGEAPHNAMLAELLASRAVGQASSLTHQAGSLIYGHRGRIALATCVRQQRDLAYLATHRRLEQMFPQYRYFGLTTREPWNLDPAHPDFVGKSYLQDFFGSGRFEQTWGTLDPGHTHIFLCGNPAMIGAPQHLHALRFYPQPTGMVEIFERRGFRLDEPHRPGNLHLEKYW